MSLCRRGSFERSENIPNFEQKTLYLKKTLFLVLLSCQFCIAYCQVNYWQQQVNYKISVTLNDVDHSLNGFEEMEYTNNSPDTLSYIWIHLWPNAFKNDKTAFSDQALQNGRTDFYFSGNEQRGYINRLDFRVNGITARLEDHPQYIDIGKLVLPILLIPGQTIKITTPFHEKLPSNFSRGGHIGQSYQVTQWFPKPAVYDKHGWHPIPYLDQGEFYSEFGNFEVQITVPQNYVVAATGELQNTEEKKWLTERVNNFRSGPVSKNQQHIPMKQKVRDDSIPSSLEMKTLIFKQNNIHDFAWFADKRYIMDHDTLEVESGRIINIYSFYPPSSLTWKKSTQFIKDAVRTRSQWLGEYPYNVVQAWETPMGFSGGMEYHTITSISPGMPEKDLDLTIEHEVGHNWLYGILGTNERDHPWMDEGMNTYFDLRYLKMKYGSESLFTDKSKIPFIISRFPDDPQNLLYRALIKSKTDQPIETSSENFSDINYGLVAYYKAGLWMQLLEKNIGRDEFDKSLHEYYSRWKFKHPAPEDFKNVVEELTGKNEDSIFSLLNTKGSIQATQKKETRVMAFGSFRNTDTHNYIFLSPAVGFNHYDKIMVGGLVHNFTIPANDFQYFMAPMYATGSKKFIGIGRIQYSWRSYGFLQKTELSLSGSKFTMDEFTDSIGNKNYLGFTKIVPSLKLTFRKKNPGSSITKFLQLKTFLISEDGLSFTRDTIRQMFVITFPTSSRYLNQLKFVVDNARVLYPYSAELGVEQSTEFIKTTFNGNYFFNYTRGGGLNVRLFAGKFIYLGDKTFNKEFETDRYHFNMTGANGYEDYTYSNYFIGRNEFQGYRSQQIMIRDGGFKVRTDLLAAKVGKSDDWLAAVNLKTSIPKNINPLQVLPVKIPFKVFLDIGTYSEAWQKDAATGRFIYDGGIQLSLLNELINIYIPIIYSKVYRDYFKSTITEKRFWKNISFSINIQKFNQLKINRQLIF